MSFCVCNNYSRGDSLSSREQNSTTQHSSAVKCTAKQNRSASASLSLLSGQVPSLHFKKFRIFRNFETNNYVVLVWLSEHSAEEYSDF